MKRALTSVVAIFGLMFAVAAPAQAYPIDVPEVTVSSAGPTAGGTITISASGFCPGELVTFTLNPGGLALGSAVADVNGDASIQAVMPVTPGVYTVTANSAVCQESSVATINVVAGGSIPRTGSDSSSTMNIALIAVGSGAGLMLLAGLKRRRPAQA